MAKNLIRDEKMASRIAFKAVNISKATYYYTPKQRNDCRKKPLDKTLEAELKTLNGYETTYGYRKVTKKLNRYNHKKIYRHMKEMNMLQPKKLKKKRYTRLPIECPIKSDIRWEGDLTYVYDGQKLNYLFTIVDAYDKEIVGDYYGLRCRAEEAVISLEEAVKKRFGHIERVNYFRVRLRLDQGSQFISNKFKKRAKELGVYIDSCGINCPNDKPYIESFFSRYKCEEVYRNEYTNYSQAFIGWVQYKQWYNHDRIHQGLGYKSIPEFKNQQKVLHLSCSF